MTPRQVELAKRICTPLQQKVLAMREKYAVEEVAKVLDKTTTEIDQIEAEGWLKLGRSMDGAGGGMSGTWRVRATEETLAMMRDPNTHPDATV
jgi:hypothetical protein